jgi:hypothetical protein
MRKRRESLPEIGNQMNAKIGKVDDDQQNRLTLRLTEEATTWAASKRKEWHRPNQQNRVTVVIIKRSRRSAEKRLARTSPRAVHSKFGTGFLPLETGAPKGT